MNAIFSSPNIGVDIIVLDKILAPAFCKRVYRRICRVVAERVRFASLEPIQQLKGIAENGRCITAVDFFDNQVKLFIGIEISPLDNLRKRSRSKFIGNVAVDFRQDLPDEFGISVFWVEHDTHLVLLRNILQFLSNFIALTAPRNAIVDNLGGGEIR